MPLRPGLEPVLCELQGLSSFKLKTAEPLPRVRSNRVKIIQIESGLLVGPNFSRFSGRDVHLASSSGRRSRLAE